MTKILLEDELTVDEYMALRNSTDWPKLTVSQIENCIKNSAFVVRAKCDHQTVAMARILFDYGYTAYISDVIVFPEFQGRGIGKMLVEHLIENVRLMAVHGNYLQISLLASPGKSGFYEKMGFFKRTEETGFGMCLRFNEH